MQRKQKMTFRMADKAFPSPLNRSSDAKTQKMMKNRYGALWQGLLPGWLVHFYQLPTGELPRSIRALKMEDLLTGGRLLVTVLRMDNFGLIAG